MLSTFNGCFANAMKEMLNGSNVSTVPLHAVYIATFFGGRFKRLVMHCFALVCCDCTYIFHDPAKLKLKWWETERYTAGLSVFDKD